MRTGDHRIRQFLLILGVSGSLTAAAVTGCAAASESEDHAMWGYDCADGAPFVWGRIDPEFELCELGTAQSPIDVSSTGAVRQPLPAPVPAYSATRLAVVNNGHSVQANVPEGAGTLRVGEETYRLRQFHWHTPSEHWLDGERYPMELHLVHEGDSGLLVVGVLVVEGRANEELDKIWKVLPRESGDEVEVNGFDPAKLLPALLGSYRYPGSLTTPPCNEGVQWIVLAAPVEMSAEQIETFRSVFFGNDRFPAGNARPLQPRNGRTVVTDAGAE